MESKVYESKNLNYVLVKPDGFSAEAGLPLIVLLHGFGSHMYDLAGLAPHIDEAGYVYAFPNAPYEVQLGPGMTGYSWATGRPGMAPPPTGGPSVDELLDAFMQEIAPETGAQDGRIILGGFSQGGGLTLTYGLPRPDVFAGLAVLSGAFRDPEATRPRLPANPTQPVFVAHGTRDSMIAIDTGRATRDFLQQVGYSVTYNEYEMAHEVSGPELSDLIAWLHNVLPPVRKA